MARSSQLWVMLLVVLFVAAVSASLVGADEAAPTTTDHAVGAKEKIENEVAPTIAEQAKAAHHTLTEEVPQTIAEKVQATKEEAIKEAEQVGEAVNSWKNWAFQRAGEWTGKGKKTTEDTAGSTKSYAQEGVNSLHASSLKAQEHATGVFNKWRNWASEKADQYRPKKNPAADAVEFVNKHTGGASTNEEL